MRKIFEVEREPRPTVGVDGDEAADERDWAQTGLAEHAGLGNRG